MYCLAVVTGIRCVVNELNMWTEISSEHPIFLKTVAELTNKNLAEETISRLDDIHNEFADLNKRVKNFYSPNYNEAQNISPGARRKAIDLCRRFLRLDREALRLYDELKNAGPEDKVWQTLIEHIIHEQRYMYKLFRMLLDQIQGGEC
ncbi:DUF2935 domain-containing protein [Lutispora saccharofermentans]|uniref:DUF2935 domain-containing protein n=1 Tax=Lutispora saccharofermentans TaxID=3024236 RepID=A0ABT1NBX1_9FIRM|nr:DUF2935 domain-containing protein [Lutispora saccharofermentans]MCQ1528760.1 DUF2935 domain-containing protein [Lutispora saccharofermentans]